MMPLVTVFIPCYNQAKVLGRAINSVLSQTYMNLEIIVGDDCSTDETSLIVQTFLKDSRIRYERSYKNLGRVANYRRGLMELALGEWYVNLDGDDYYDNRNYIEQAISLAQERSDSVLVFGRQKYLQSNSGKIIIKGEPKVNRWSEGKEFLLNYFTINEGIPHMSALYRVSIARTLNLFSNDIVFADAEAMLRLLPWGAVGYSAEFSGIWVFHGENDSHNLNIDLRLKNLKFITEPAIFFIQSGVFNSIEAFRWQYHGLVRLIRETLHFYLDNFEYHRAFQFWLISTKHWSFMDRLQIWFSLRLLLRLIFPWFSKLKTWMGN